MRDSLFTGFGRRHEDAALAELERRCHAPIHSRNEELWTWVFPADAEAVGPDRPPRLERKRRAWSWGLDKKDEEDEEGEDDAGAMAAVEVDDEEMDGGGKSEGKADEKVGKEGGGAGGLSEGMVKGAAAGGAAGAEETQPQPQPPPPPSRADPWRRGPQRYFVVTGSIDGMREEVSFGSEGEWQLASVIVEVKHRVREEALQKQQAPPFYEQLQLATYMLMLTGENGTEYDVRGDLVEVVKTRGQRKRRDRQQPPELESEAPVTPMGAPVAAASTATVAAAEEGGGGADETNPSPSPLPMAVTRITLDGSGDGADSGRGLDHRRLYYQHVVCRNASQHSLV